MCPLYEYRCESCGKTLEKLESFSADSVQDCPECSNRTLNRVVSSGTGFVLHGNGWAKHGYSS